MKFPHSFGKMDNTTTRAMARKEKVKANTLISDPDDTNIIDKDETKVSLISDPDNTKIIEKYETEVSDEIKHNMVHKYKNNRSLSLKDKMKKMFIFF